MDNMKLFQKSRDDDILYHIICYMYVCKYAFIQQSDEYNNNYYYSSSYEVHEPIFNLSGIKKL